MVKRAIVLLLAFLFCMATPRALASERKEYLYSVDVDVTNQVVTVYGKDTSGEYKEIVKRMICSTGRDETPTPIGDSFAATARREWAYMTDSEVYVKYATRVFRDYFFHSLLYEQQDESTLIKSSYNNLGRKASHGCIRLLTEDAKWIYDNLEYGTPVRVFEGKSNPDLTKRLKPTGPYPTEATAAPSEGQVAANPTPSPKPKSTKTSAPKKTSSPKRSSTPKPTATPKKSSSMSARTNRYR